jgi:hypothetical protein
MWGDWSVVANIGLLVANLGVLGLTMKLYTEFAKDRFQASRRVDDHVG